MIKPIRRFFPRYGSKWQIAPKYPPPKYKRIIEPFAGAAGYSHHYYQHNVHLYEIDSVIYSLWKYLIGASAAEIRALPLNVWHVDDMKGCCQEAKYLVGFWIGNAGSGTPAVTPSTMYMSGLNAEECFWGEKIRERIATQVDLIRHWKIYNACYSTAPNTVATWFVDPPYHGAGRHYKHSNIDYKHLAKWCKSRNGQVTVCENIGADWLPFKEHLTTSGAPGRISIGRTKSVEVIWTNQT